MKRIIKYIVIHCTASSTDLKIPSLLAYWKEQLGWTRPGYHYIIGRDGFITRLQKEEELANGVKGHNAESIHISYIGGIDKNKKPIDNRTDAQMHAMFDKIVELTERYPGAKVVGHRDFPNVHKACPCFDVRAWLAGYIPPIDMAA